MSNQVNEMIDKSKIFIILSYIFVIYISLLALIFIFQRSLMYFPVKEKISKSFYENTQLKISILCSVWSF